MEKIILKAHLREIKGKKVKTIRSQGFIPAVVYGHEVKPANLSVKYQDFEKVFKKAGYSTLVDLEIGDGEPRKVLIIDVQKEPVTQRILHIDFHQVKMTEKITAEVPLSFVGEAPAVEQMDGVLVKNMDSLEVSCLPADLPHEIEVDISSLVDFDSEIRVKDLKLPAGVEVGADLEEVVALVTPPRSDEELAALEEAPAEEVEAVEEVSKKEEGVVVEGEETASETSRPAEEA